MIVIEALNPTTQAIGEANQSFSAANLARLNGLNCNGFERDASGPITRRFHRRIWSRGGITLTARRSASLEIF